MNSASWTDDGFFSRTFLSSGVDYDSVRGVKAAVEAGVPVSDLMRSEPAVRRRVERLARDGAGAGVLHEALTG